MTNPIDSLLRDWAFHHAPDDKSFADLERQVAVRMRETRHMPSVALSAPPAFSPLGRLAWFSLGAATALAIALLSLSPPPAPKNTDATELVRPSQSARCLFAEMNRLFDGNLRWVTQSDGEIELGIDPAKDGSEPGATTFGVHIAVISRSDNEGPWKKVWETDILTRSEESIDIAPYREGDDRVALWVYPVAEGRFAVDSRLSLNEPVRIYSNGSDVAQDGQPKAIAVMIVGAIEYRVYQTVTCLKPKENGPC